LRKLPFLVKREFRVTPSSLEVDLFIVLYWLISPRAINLGLIFLLDLFAGEPKVD
jgi:hypothetical protein